MCDKAGVKLLVKELKTFTELWVSCNKERLLTKKYITLSDKFTPKKGHICNDLEPIIITIFFFY